MSNQDCSRSKKVLRTADMLVASLGVTSSWGSTDQAVVDAEGSILCRVKTIICLYDTIISLMTFIIAIITE